MSNHYDYLEAGFKVFGLMGRTDHNGDELPEKEQFKKPYAGNWQHTPNWSDEQLETMEEMGQFETGFGVLCDGFVIIDIDPRNGGTIEQVQEYYDQSQFIVATGGGGWHIYFKAPKDAALVSHLKDYKGIDFKSTGFVVGSGSLHYTGGQYEAIKGNPCDIEDAPDKLISLLKKPEKTRVETSLGKIDVGDQEIKQMLKDVDPDCEYEDWIKVGMAIHHGTGGNGFELWDEWSSNGEKYDPDKMERHWHSFGKASSPITLATLIHMSDYEQPVEFYSDVVFEENDDVISVDLKRPPGLVGDIAEWINGQCRYPRENLAVAAALQVVGNAAGLYYVDGDDGNTANLINFCVAGSSTGKEAIQQSFLECMRLCNLSAAVHGAIKSEQEIIRNLIRHQAALYSIDELGIVLRKIVNSSGKSGATYLEGVIALIMSGYSKADSFLTVSGDLKEDLRKELAKELGMLQKKQDENEGDFQHRIDQVTHALENIDNGLEKPFLSIIGYTTPVTFNDLVTYEMATNGFVSRAMIFEEPETNPKRKRGFKKEPMSEQLKMRLMGLCQSFNQGRIENYGKKATVSSRDDAQDELDNVYEYFYNMAEESKEKGLEAIPRRGYELVAKVSFILAIGDGLRTKSHVQWAFELVKKDIQQKMRLAYSNTEKNADGIATKIQSVLTSCDENGLTMGVLCNRCRPFSKEDVEKVVAELEKQGLVKITDHESNNRNKKRTKRIVLK